MKKRIFALLLAFVMLAGMLPVSAFATEATELTEPTAALCEMEGCEFTAGHEGNCSNADKVAAQIVIDLIAAIGEVTLESEPAISAADMAYSQLTDEQKLLVTNLDVLEAAKEAYMQLSAVPAPVEDSVTIETGDVAEFVMDAYIGKIVLKGVSGAVTGSGQNWEVELPEGTDPTKSITFELTSAVTMKPNRYFWVNGERLETPLIDADPGSVTFVPEWYNGRATVTACVGTASKASGTQYTIELSIKGLAKEDFNTVRLDEAKTKKYFVQKVFLSGADATAFSVSDTDYSGNTSGHKATIEYQLDAMPTSPVQLIFTMATSGSFYIACNGADREEGNDTYTTEVDLKQGTAYTFITYSTASNNTVRGTYTIKFNVAGVDLNTAPTLKDGAAAEEEKTFTSGETYTLDLASLFKDGELDDLSYTVQIGDEAPVSAAAEYSLLLDKAGDYTLVFRANDGKLTSEDCYTAKLKVVQNTAPTLVDGAAASETIEQYAKFTLDLTKIFADAEGNDLSYTVKVNGGSAQTAAANYSYTANEEGTFTLVFQAEDHELTSPEYTVTLTVKYIPKTEISSSCAGGENGDTWVKTFTVIGAEVDSYEWNVEAGHTESEEHILNIQLKDSVADNAVLQLLCTPAYVNSNFRGSVSGPSSVTMVDGEATVTVTTKGWMNKGTARTYILKFTNKHNNAPVATAPTATAEVVTGSEFTIDLSKIFSDPDGDALIYTVTANEETVVTESAFTKTIGASGEYTFTFTATDVWNAAATHTVTVTVKQSDAKFDATVKVPEGITPDFYIANGFDEEKVDICGDTLTATAGTAENGFVPYTVQIPENVSRISFRGTDADGNPWGGMTAEVAKDMEPVTMVKVLGVIPSKVNNVYATAQQALFQLKDKDGYFVTSGSTATDDYGIVNYRFLTVAFGTDDLALAYTAYVIPQGDAAAQYVTTIGSNKTFTKEQPQQITQLGMTLKSGFTVTVPEGATVQAFQWKQYYKADEIPVSDTVKNEDGTVNWLFVKGDAFRMTYRASMEGKLTKVGYVNGDKVTITWSEDDPAPTSRTPYDTSTLYGSRGDDSMVVNVNGQNHLVMTSGSTFRLRGYRIWEVINNDTNNVMIQPDMRYTLTGDNIVTVTPVNTGNGNGQNNWLDLTATGSGVAYLEMSYDAMQVVTGNASGWGGEELAGFVFNACDPARTALVVVQVGNAATDVSFGIRGNSTINGQVAPWDAEFDTLYFVGNSGKLELAPTVSTGSIVKVEVSGDKGASWKELTAVDGVYAADIISGNNIIRVTKDDCTEAYQVVRGDKVTVTMAETSGDGDNVPEPGESFRLQLNGLHNPIGKMSGNYNPGYQGGQHLYYKFNGSTVYTTVNYQYDFVSNAWVDVTIPETAKSGDVFTLTNGYIGFNVIGIGDFLDNKENHRGITDDGHMTRGAGASDHQRSILPELTLTVRDSEAEVNNVIKRIDAIETENDKAAAVQAARTAYSVLSDAQKAKVTNYEKLTAAEKALADAADADAAKAVEALIRQIGEVTLEDETAIAQAREAYDTLTQTQKDLVDPDLLLALENAEAELIVLKDKRAAKEVDDLIVAIGEITLEKESKIEVAKAAYAALASNQKKHVTKLSVLEEAEQKLQMLKNTGGVDYGLDPDEIVGYATVSFEDYGIRVESENIAAAYKNPRGVIIPATKVPFKAYDTIASVTLRLLKAKGISASYQGNEFSGFYLSSVGGFGEFDAGSGSGWMITWNGWFINKGASEFAVQNGDTVRWQYTCQLGADIGDNSYYGAVTEVIALIDTIGTVAKDSGDQIKAARAAYDKLSDADKKRVSNYKKLTDAETAYEALMNEDMRNVEKLIDAIGTVTLDSKDKIEAARKAYDALPTAQKVKVSNYTKLTDAESKLRQLQKEADEKAAKKVEDLIDALDNKSAAFEDDVKAAKAAYDALTDDQKKLVGNYEKLANALKELASEEDKEAAEKVEKLIKAIGTVTLDSKNKIKAAREAYDKLTDEQKALVGNLAVLEAAEEKLAALKSLAGIEDIYKTTGDYLEKLGTPVPGSVGGEWMVIGLNRSGRETPDAYYDNAVKFVQENIDENERLHTAKSTENSRMILALTAIGKDVTNVGGHNLLSGLNDMAYVQKQGINGPIWALIAFDSGNYPTPEGNVTREALVQTILDAQLPDGGWALSGSTSDPDMTGMALQALVPYYNADADVKKTVDVALITLSDIQRDDGSFSSIDGKNIESVAQVVTALAALGIDADTDPRFIKNGVSALDALCAFYVEGGGFRHTPDGKLDGMATEQGYYALTAYFRMLDGKTALYDMTDMLDMGGDVADEEPTETLPTETEPVPTEPVDTPAKGGRNFPWWIIIVIVVLAGSLVVLVIISKPKKGRHMK